MRITTRSKTIAFFITLGVGLIALAVALNVGWIILNWREGVLLVLGVIFFAVIIAGLVLNTIYLVREIRINEQHDSFINAVTHELKTPIASLRLYLETLQYRRVEEEQRRDFYRLMIEDTERLLATVEQVLKAGKAGHRRLQNRSEVEMGGLVRECLELARTRHNLQPQALRYSVFTANGDRHLVLGDADELRAAVSNLLDNAIKYSVGQVEVNVELASPDPRHIAVRVRDRGVGIPAGELKKIFKRFHRVPNQAVPQVKGTGLGLFIVRAIARKHGGRAFAESEGVGRGATVTLLLPRISA